MATISGELRRTGATSRLSPSIVRDVAASLAISVMWLAVLFDAVFGPDFVSASSGSTTRIPSGIVVAVLATLATRSVARYAFGQTPKGD